MRVLARQIFSSGGGLTVARVQDGVSTYVYRVVRGDDVFFLRVLPEVGKTFAPEVLAHTTLRERGASVPEIVYYTPWYEPFGLAVMVTTAIPGEALAQRGLDANARAIVAAAGRDLALINSVAVVGFGWIVRDAPHVSTLTAELPDNRTFSIGNLDADLAVLRAAILDRDECAALERVVARYEGWLESATAILAHGDFDSTHIFAHAGRYSGIIDFGEIRGTDRWYDLAHFALRDGERFDTPLLPWLLDGYRAIAPLPPEADARIAFAALLIGVQLLARSIARRGIAWHDSSALRAIRRGIALLA